MRWRRLAAKVCATETDSTKPMTEISTADPASCRHRSRSKRGSVSGGFDGMWSGGDGGHDVDLDQSLQFQMDPPNCERLHLRGAFWLIEDLGSSSGHGTLNDIDDAFNEGVIARVSHLYMDVDDLWKDSTLRVGRHKVFRIKILTRDGQVRIVTVRAEQ